ncbi:malonyl-ACP O-methyltransferase BioC [Thalassomonas sp. M1454]|uniref:malonyl-ACP O-methyltransferase BioC n=1 Tax=Thalassomonas sp. M1454 TaxID=2594477 RepID=UPI00117BE408|nr:malonyl-ACP O-methyltransferase BioC [Thalassomonas sp. M1454]TRX56860.1 malonyl-ACP O-methyltransferase BioC [Thalassomonas sp. M1454]
MPTEQLKVKIADTFGAASESYDVSARLQRQSGNIILSYLQQNTAKTKNPIVVDLGTGTGYFADILKSDHQNIIGLDLSKSMLQYASNNRNKDINWLAADIHQLPFADNSIDIIYSNLVIQWCDPLHKAFAEIERVLKPGGTFVFTTLLDGTLSELKKSWANVNDDQHVIDFKQLVDVENDIKTTNFNIEILKQQPIVLDYISVKHLANELKSLGASHLPNKVNKGLSGKGSWQKMTKAYQQFQSDSGCYPATYQLCTGKLVKHKL